LRKALFEITVAGQPSEHVEWDRSFGASLDGFELLRPVPAGAPETTIRVMLWLDHLPQRWKLAPALSVLLGLHTDTKPRIVTQLWQYIKIHRLQDPDDKRVIHLNPQLKLLFPGTETILFPDIGRLIEPHLLPPDPLELAYQVKLTGPPTGAEEVWEAIVDMEEGSPLSGQIRKELDQLDEQIVTISRQLEERRQRRDIYWAMAEHPRETAAGLVALSTREVVLQRAGLEGRNLDLERSAAYFLHPLLPAACQTYLTRTNPGPQPALQAAAINPAPAAPPPPQV
jgi:SWI/SNF-related matrix-associated actin-dependent regulator of chromatin subfamily D